MRVTLGVVATLDPHDIAGSSASDCLGRGKQNGLLSSTTSHFCHLVTRSKLYEAGKGAGMKSMQTDLTSSKQHSDLTDDVLAQQAQSGDQDAFEMLVDRYSTLLLRLISQMVRDEYLAHDILQDVLLQLYHSLPRLQRGGTLKAWLCQVARRRCIDELRRKRPIFFSEILLLPDEDEFSPPIALLDPDPQPEEQVELHEVRQRLLAAIERLPSRYRMVVLLRHTNHLSFREIGQVLSMPASTAKTYFHRAKKRLRTLLGPEFMNY
jgi:RNA polymerase sigma factor (sigma-70 family)